MNQQQFLPMLEDLLEVDSGSLKLSDLLSEVESWDSLSIVSFMGLAKAKFNLNLTAKAVSGSQTVADLLKLLQGHGESSQSN